ncbi:unnamed protein product, partial [Durusdinium trenchii]
RPMVNGVSCGQRFAHPSDALQVPDLEDYWGAHRIVTCDAPVFWVNFSLSGNTKRYLDISAGTLHPASSFSSDRLWDLRVDALVLAPGLPQLDPSTLEIDLPAEVGSFGQLLQSPEDVSTCAHRETQLAVQVRQGLCGYFDNFGAWGVWSSVLLDRHVEVSGDGLVAFWLRGGTTGKFWVMLGTAGPEQEDLIGTQLIPKASCDCGAVDPLRPGDAFSGHMDFWELWTPSGEGLPLVRSCAGGATRDSYCRLESTTTSTESTTTTTTTTAASTTAEGSSTTSTTRPDTTENMGSTVSGSTTSTSAPESTTSSTSSSTSTSTTSTSTSTTSTLSMDGMGCGHIDCPFRRGQMAAMARMQRAMDIEYSCDPGIDFVRGMIPHHQGAVEMCNVLDGAQLWSEVGMVHFCNHVYLAQTWEVQGMRRWLQEHHVPEEQACRSNGCNTSCQEARAYQAANEKMHEAMAINYTCKVEQDFVQAMMPHHQGAVDMCAILLTSTEDEYLLGLCRNITRLQRAELAWMQDWLTYKAVPIGASCSPSVVRADDYCADLMPITDVCHDLGGDRICDCSGLLDSCSTTISARGRRFAVSMVCQESCGLCEEQKSATDIVVDLLRLVPITQAPTSAPSTTESSAESTISTRRPSVAVASSAGTWVRFSWLSAWPWLALVLGC